MTNTKKTIIIFIGLKGLGKSLLSDKLKEVLKGTHSVRVFHEDETLLPIKDEQDEKKVIEFYQKLTDTVESCPEQVIILDRFYANHATENPRFFHPVEQRLLRHEVVVFLLTIPEEEIENRLRETKEFRGDSWNIGATGRSFESEAENDALIQRQYKEVMIPGVLIKNVFEIDTLKRDWDEYIAFIKSKLVHTCNDEAGNLLRL
jgi:broad-specificity NMP kinase